MNFICQCCFEEIEGKEYALPFNNIDNVCHVDCVQDWFEANLDFVIAEETVYVEEE